MTRPGRHDFDLIIASDRAPARSAGAAQRALFALTPMLGRQRGVWFTAPDAAGDRAPWAQRVEVSTQDLSHHRNGQCASTLAPIYHGRNQRPVFKRPWHEAYRRVNQRFAQRIADSAATGARVWIHDYHLQLVPGMLRTARPDLRIGFFLHSPFPPAELFLQLPDRDEILTGLLGADVIGFQHERSATNFLALVQQRREVAPRARRLRVEAMPMPADTSGAVRLAADEPVRDRARQIREALRDPSTVFLSLAGWDPAEGAEQRLDAFAHMLSRGLVDPADTAFLHLAPRCPSTEAQQELRQRIERRVAQINGVYSQVSRCVVHYQHRDLDPAELAAHYLAADVMVATTLTGNLGLTAKEFAAVHDDGRARIVFSDLAVSALPPESIAVNVHDVDAFAHTMAGAALAAGSVSAGMKTLHALVTTEDVGVWADTFLTTLDRCPPRGLSQPLTHHERQIRRDQAGDRDHGRLTVAAPYP